MYKLTLLSHVVCYFEETLSDPDVFVREVPTILLQNTKVDRTYRLFNLCIYALERMSFKVLEKWKIPEDINMI